MPFPPICSFLTLSLSLAIFLALFIDLYIYIHTYYHLHVDLHLQLYLHIIFTSPCECKSSTAADLERDATIRV